MSPLKSIPESEAKKMLEEQKKISGIKSPSPLAEDDAQPYGD